RSGHQAKGGDDEQRGHDKGHTQDDTHAYPISSLDQRPLLSSFLTMTTALGKRAAGFSQLTGPHPACLGFRHPAFRYRTTQGDGTWRGGDGAKPSRSRSMTVP